MKQSIYRTKTVFEVGIREYSRNYILIGLLIVLPIAFISLAFAVTQDVEMPVRLPVDGEMTTVMRGMPDVHGIIMTPLTSTMIAGLIGLFLMETSKNADERLPLAGYRSREVITARFGTLVFLISIVTVVSVGVMTFDVMPQNFWWFLGAMFVLSLIYGLIGMLVGVLFNKLAGLWTILILSMLDVGVFQDPLFVAGEPSWWMKLFPAYHPVRVIVDSGLTSGIDTAANLVLSIVYLLVVGIIAVLMFYRQTRIN